jgi:hypothetical protein
MRTSSGPCFLMSNRSGLSLNCPGKASTKRLRRRQRPWRLVWIGDGLHKGFKSFSRDNLDAIMTAGSRQVAGTSIFRGIERSTAALWSLWLRVTPVKMRMTCGRSISAEAYQLVSSHQSQCLLTATSFLGTFDENHNPRAKSWIYVQERISAVRRRSDSI